MSKEKTAAGICLGGPASFKLQNQAFDVRQLSVEIFTVILLLLLARISLEGKKKKVWIICPGRNLEMPCIQPHLLEVVVPVHNCSFKGLKPKSQVGRTRAQLYDAIAFLASASSSWLPVAPLSSSCCC